MTPASLPPRIAAKIQVSDSGCWLWTGAVKQDGYGLVRYDGRCQRAHRVVFALAGNTLRDGLVLDHLCRVRNCVRPEHLRQVTQGENMQEVLREINARRAVKPYCRWGHPLPERTPEMQGKFRYCRTCSRKRSREYQAARRAALKAVSA